MREKSMEELIEEARQMGFVVKKINPHRGIVEVAGQTMYKKQFAHWMAKQRVAKALWPENP